LRQFQLIFIIKVAETFMYDHISSLGRAGLRYFFE